MKKFTSSKTMTEYQHEKRRHCRVIFKNPSQIAALISMDDQGDQEKVVSSSILNMSEGGIHISIERNFLDRIEQGRKITLQCISGLPDLSSFSDIQMQVVWIIDHEYLDHILIGTCFCGLSEEQRGALSSFVDSCLKKKSLQGQPDQSNA